MPNDSLKLSSILDSLKTEARVKGTDEIDAWIVDLINQTVFDETYQNRFQELYVPLSEVTVLTNTSEYALPEDFQTLERVYFSPWLDGAMIELTIPNSNLILTQTYGYPRFYRLAGTALQVYPYSLLVADQARLAISYYKSHPLFTLGSLDDLLLVPKLRNVVIKACAARVHVYYKEFQSGQVLGNGAMVSNSVTQDSSQTYSNG